MNIVAFTNCVVELAFYSTAVHGDPYNEVEMDVLFSGPAGEQRAPAFWAGDHVWKVRFAAEKPGRYTYKSVCSDAGDSGLHNQSGTVQVEPYQGKNPLLAHGRLRVAKDRRHFEHADGTPFFWVGDTWWMGLCTRLDWPQGFQMLAADRVAKGFNVVQIITGPYPDMDAWDARGRNEAGFPFTDGFKSINPAYYDHADLKIAHLVHSGIVPCIVGMWGYYLPQMGVDRVKRYWRYIVARYGAYPVVWCMAGEGAMPWYLTKTHEQDIAAQRKGWTEVMAYVRGMDPYHNLIGIHPTHCGRDQVEDASLMDFDMLQTGHSDIESVPNVAQTVAKSVAREPLMPVVNSEVNYEGILGRCWQNIQRLCFYHAAIRGAAGCTYGANGIWQASTLEFPYGASPHGRCWGNTPWQEAMQLPGSKQIGIGGGFMKRFRWWEFREHPEWIDAAPDPKNPYACVAAGIPGEVRVVYIPHCWTPPLLKAIEDDARHTAQYFDPCTGKDYPLGEVQPDEHGDWRPPLPVEVHDWLLVLETHKR